MTEAELQAADIARLAELHRQSLPGSIVSRLGTPYTRRFYRYVARSREENLFVIRGPDRQIDGAVVFSWRPDSLQRRLIMGTSMVFWAALRFWVTVPQLYTQLVAGRDPSAPAEDLPELLIIYCDARIRGKGFGTRLLEACERGVVSRGANKYVLKTEAVPGNRAIDFYLKHGFEPVCELARAGRGFVYFTKQLTT